MQEGDLVRVPPLRLTEARQAPVASAGLAASLEEAVLYEDADMMVINKPSGLAVHGGSGISLGLIETLRQIRPQAKFLELVHRLDRDTSGCIMVAKNAVPYVSCMKHCARRRLPRFIMLWWMVNGRPVKPRLMHHCRKMNLSPGSAS